MTTQATSSGLRPPADPPPRRLSTSLIRIRPPEVVPISEEDYQQAVTALATMIASW